MKYRPILFSGPMVRALLNGRKTQTRRVVKMKLHHQIEERDDGTLWPWMYDADRNSDFWMSCPYGQPGDRLYVRETWAAPHAYDHLPPRLIPKDARIHYAATEDRGGLLWRPSIHMPRWASRITLEITGVRVERLQDISEADAAAEGIERPEDMSTEAIEAMDVWPTGSERECFNALNQPVHQYRRLWGQINGPESWDANPWVWVVEFRRLEGVAA